MLELTSSKNQVHHSGRFSSVGVSEREFVKIGLQQLRADLMELAEESALEQAPWFSA